MLVCLIVAIVALFCGGCGKDAEKPPAAKAVPSAGSATAANPAKGAPLRGRRAGYETAKARARAWLDQLEVDPVELMKHNVKGKKKLAEILDCYAGILKRTRVASDRDAVRRRVEALGHHTERPEYHDMLQVPDEEFRENSMSYLRVAWLLERFGLDTKLYREEILSAKPRFDAHLLSRGPWQRAMFLEYYERFGLKPPANLPPALLEGGVVSRRVPVAAYDVNAVYNLTHEVFVAYDYGDRREQTRFSSADLAYMEEVIPQLIERYVRADNADLTGELLSCMTYLGRDHDPSYGRAVEYLLGAQNATGTWGKYEAYRPQFGAYLDQHAYLHTTMVVLGALMEAFEGVQPALEAPGGATPSSGG